MILQIFPFNTKIRIVTVGLLYSKLVLLCGCILYIYVDITDTFTRKNVYWTSMAQDTLTKKGLELTSGRATHFATCVYNSIGFEPTERASECFLGKKGNSTRTHNGQVIGGNKRLQQTRVEWKGSLRFCVPLKNNKTAMTNKIAYISIPVSIYLAHSPWKADN